MLIYRLCRIRNKAEVKISQAHTFTQHTKNAELIAVSFLAFEDKNLSIIQVSRLKVSRNFKHSNKRKTFRSLIEVRKRVIKQGIVVGNEYLQLVQECCLCRSIKSKECNKRTH